MAGSAADGTGTVNETENDDTARKQAEDEARLEEIRRIQEEIRQLSEARENLINANNELDMGCKELLEAQNLLANGGLSTSGKSAYTEDFSKMMEASQNKSEEIGNQINKIDSSISELQEKVNSLSNHIVTYVGKDANGVPVFIECTNKSSYTKNSDGLYYGDVRVLYGNDKFGRDILKPDLGTTTYLCRRLIV